MHMQITEAASRCSGSGID